MAISKLTGSRALAGGGLLPVIRKFGINSTPTGVEQNTNIVLPAKCAVLDVWLDVRTAESTGTAKTLDIGTNGSASNDPNGFAAAISVASAGIKRPEAAVATGSNEVYFSATTRGALLANFNAGTDTATDTGTNLEKPDLTSGGDTVTYTAGSNDWAEFRGDIYVMYVDLT